MVRGTSALLILGLTVLALAELLLAPALGSGTSSAALRAAAALGALVVTAAIIAVAATSESRFALILLGVGIGMFAAAFDAIGARSAATLPEALAWGALGMLFARTFDTPGAAIAVPLLVAGLTLGGFAGDHSALTTLPHGGDPLTLELPAFGGGASLVLPVLDATLIGALATWGSILDVRRPWTAILVVEAAAFGAAIGIDPIGLLVIAFLVPNYDRALAALQR